MFQIRMEIISHLQVDEKKKKVKPVPDGIIHDMIDLIKEEETRQVPDINLQTNEEREEIERKEEKNTKKRRKIKRRRGRRKRRNTKKVRKKRRKKKRNRNKNKLKNKLNQLSKKKKKNKMKFKEIPIGLDLLPIAMINIVPVHFTKSKIVFWMTTVSLNIF